MAHYDYIEEDGSSHASLYQDVFAKIRNKNFGKHTVKVSTVDFLIGQYSLESIDLLKIDTEGNEYKVLRGAEQAIAGKAIKVIHFEFNEMNLVSRVKFRDFWDILKGYNLFRILPGGRLLPIKQYNTLYGELYAYQNIVAYLK